MAPVLPKDTLATGIATNYQIEKGMHSISSWLRSDKVRGTVDHHFSHADHIQATIHVSNDGVRIGLLRTLRIPDGTEGCDPGARLVIVR